MPHSTVGSNPTLSAILFFKEGIIVLKCPVCKKEYSENTVSKDFWYSIFTNESGYVNDVCENCFELYSDEELLDALGKKDETIKW